MPNLHPLVLTLFLATLASAAEPTKTDLFQANTQGYETYRIPGIVITKKGTVLIYCEARKSAKSDWGHIDVLLRRSTDGGASFDAPRKIVDPPADFAPAAKPDDITVNNPVAIADPQSGAVHFIYCINYAHCFYMRSDDDGQTFSKPADITSALEELRKQYDWKVFATGPGHGIRLKTGRLLIPVWLANGKSAHDHRPSCLATLYSDDTGKTWHAGAIVAKNSLEIPNPNESMAVELSDGSIMINTRNESKKHLRLIAISKDGISNWSKPTYDESLPEPICMASIIAGSNQGQLIFSNPAGEGHLQGKPARRNLTIRISNDDGKTWPTKKLLEPGIAGYSDLAILPSGQLLCFYECGGVNDQQTFTSSLRLARVAADWITEK